MGSFDAAGVIKAAATSNLGVVSLIVLVLAFLAWRFFQQSDDKVKLIAFAMIFLGAAGFVTAVMLAGGEGGVPGAGPTETRTSEPPVETPTASETAASPAGAAGQAVNIAGAWHDTEGYRYTVIQDGTAFSYTVVLGGASVGRGFGTIAGTHLRYRYVDDRNGGEGTCEADATSDARAIKGSCGDGTATWVFLIER